MTGVQTCALPISGVEPEVAPRLHRLLGLAVVAQEHRVGDAGTDDQLPARAVGDRPVNLEVKKYRGHSGWLPYAEVAVGVYFVSMVVFAIQTYNYFAIPFLLLFVFGYWWAGFGTLYQEYQGRLQWLKQRKLELARQI